MREREEERTMMKGSDAAERERERGFQEKQEQVQRKERK